MMKKASFLLFRIICIAFSVMLLLMSLMTGIAASESESDIAELQRDIALQQSENKRLTAITESRLSLEKLDAYATQVLGMQHPVQGQIYYIEMMG